LLLEIVYAGKLKKKEGLSHLIKLLKKKAVIEAKSMLCKRPQRNLHDLCVSNFQNIDNRFNNMDARFMTLDEHIEPVHNQIFDLQFADEEE